jgi:hypothetical protein
VFVDTAGGRRAAKQPGIELHACARRSKDIDCFGGSAGGPDAGRRVEIRKAGRWSRAASKAFPRTLAEIQSYDALFISNLAAGDLGQDAMKLMESAVRDFGVGLVCVGGDQTYAAGGYRGTPLETTLPVNMELDSKKVLPSGAVAMVMHGMEFMNGNQIARDCALGRAGCFGAAR